MTRFHVNRRQFIGSAAALSAAALLHHPATAEEALEQRVGLTPSATYPELKSTLTIADPSRIRMLQLTDIHFYGNDDPAMDLRTLEEIPRLIDKTQPEILLVSGDLWSDNPDGRGAEYQAFALDKLAKWGVPWLFVWGNHVDPAFVHTVGGGDVAAGVLTHRGQSRGVPSEAWEIPAVIVAVSLGQVFGIVLEVEVVHHGQCRHSAAQGEIAVGRDEGIGSECFQFAR